MSERTFPLTRLAGVLVRETVVTGRGFPEPIRLLWQTLLASSEAFGYTSDLATLEAYTHAFSHPVTVVVFESHGAPFACFAFERLERDWAILCCPFADFNGVLIRRDRSDGARCLWEWTREARVALTIPRLERRSQLLLDLRSHDALCRLHFGKPSVYPAADLRGGWNGFLTKCRSRARQAIRRHVRQSARRQMQFRPLSAGKEVDEALEFFFQHHCRRHPFSAYADARRRDFFRRLVRLHTGCTTLALFDSGGTIAVAFYFHFSRRLLFLDGAWDEDRARLGPGRLHHANALKWAADQGYDEYDFLLGAEAYKYRYATHERFASDVTLVTGDTPKQPAAVRGVEGGRRAAFVVAHPDDEVIFFLGRILEFLAKGVSVDVYYVNTATHDLDYADTRRSEAEAAAASLGVGANFLGEPDGTSGARVERLADRLAAAVHGYARVCTHGPLGEYFHPDHVRTSLAVSLAFPEQAELLLAQRHTGDFAPGLLLEKKRIMCSYYKSQWKMRDWGTESESYASAANPDLRELTTLLTQLLEGEQRASAEGAVRIIQGSLSGVPMTIPARTVTKYRARLLHLLTGPARQ